MKTICSSSGSPAVRVCIREFKLCSMSEPGVIFFSARSLTSHPTSGWIVGELIEFLKAATDCFAGTPQDLGNVFDSAMSQPPGLHGGIASSIFLTQRLKEMLHQRLCGRIKRFESRSRHP